MVSSCSAFGCTYRHKRGSNIGLYRFPHKDEKLCKRWVLALRRVNWWPSRTSRICGKHFLTGRPAKNEFHPDYVPSVFVYNQHEDRKVDWQRIAEETATERVTEILYKGSNNDVPGYRPLRPKLDGCGGPFVIIASKADQQQPVKPTMQSSQFSGVMKENIGNRIKVENPNKNSFLTCKEVTPSVPQRVSLQNFQLEKKNSSVSIEKAKVKNKPKSAEPFKDKDHLYEGSSLTISDDDSTLTAESSIPASEDTDSCMSPFKNISFHDNDGTEYDALNNVSSPVVHSVAENATDPDYSEFKSTPSDTKDILAIKLETMLAVNISLQQKVKIYQSRCKNYEKEISELRSIIKKLKLKNPLSHYKK